MLNVFNHERVLKFEFSLNLTITCLVLQIIELFEIWSEDWLEGLNMRTFNDLVAKLSVVPSCATLKPPASGADSNGPAAALIPVRPRFRFFSFC